MRLRRSKIITITTVQQCNFRLGIECTLEELFDVPLLPSHFLLASF